MKKYAIKTFFLVIIFLLIPKADIFAGATFTNIVVSASATGATSTGSLTGTVSYKVTGYTGAAGDYLKLLINNAPVSSPCESCWEDLYIGDSLSSSSIGQSFTGTLSSQFDSLTPNTEYKWKIRQENTTNVLAEATYPTLASATVGDSQTASTTATSTSSDVYTFLAPLGEITTWSQDDDLYSYLNFIIKTIIILASVFAVVMIMIGGFEYLSSDAIGSKQDGLKRIQDAIWGLLIALFSWLLLNTINPDILNTKLDIQEAEISGADVPQTAEGGKYCQGDYTSGDTWADVSPASTYNPVTMLGITVNNIECQKVGDPSCTSTRGLDLSIVQSVLNGCGGPNTCLVTITGGTECWLHGKNTAHKPGNATVDIKASPLVNKYITGGVNKNGEPLGNGGTAWPGDCGKYVRNGKTFWAEEPKCPGGPMHWHAY